MRAKDHATPPATSLDNLCSRLENAYRQILKERMADIPILNHDIQIEAVGFQIWERKYLGVMITPWFMNLMLLPLHENWSELVEGTTVAQIFPSGMYDFIIGQEQDIGPYQMCSLFSPMFNFENHAAAVATAHAVMSAIMDEENQSCINTQAKRIEKIWHGDEQAEDRPEAKQVEDSDDTVDVIEPPTSSKTAETISRREVLRGSFLRSADRASLSDTDLK